MRARCLEFQIDQFFYVMEKHCKVCQREVREGQVQFQRERESRLKYKYNKFERGSLYGAAPNDPETKESQLALKTRALVLMMMMS